MGLQLPQEHGLLGKNDALGVGQEDSLLDLIAKNAVLQSIRTVLNAGKRI